jgi:4-amino-4-deoxy-L-arabinose transferase-like glycosyltransferase
MKKLSLALLHNQDLQILLILAGLAIALGTVGLGNVPLRDFDEGYYATVAQDMLRQGNWLFPTYQGQPFWLKPPLIMWLMEMSYWGLGISEFSSRLPTALLSALAVPLIYAVGREIFAHRSTALYGSLVYLTLLPMMRHGRLAMLDGMINSFLLFSLWCSLRSRTAPRWAMGIGIGLGLIALAKGVLALAFVAILGVFLGWEGGWKRLCNPSLLWGMLLGFLPITVWYGLQISQYGQEFIDIHFKAQSIDRISSSVEGNRGNIAFYWAELGKYTVPWLFFFPQGIGLAFKNRRETWGKLILSFTVLYFTLISAMGTKLPWYIIPFYPFFALAVGFYLDRLRQSSQPYPKYLAFLLGLCGLIGLGGAVYFGSQGQILLAVMALVLAVTMAMTVGLLRYRNAKFIATMFVGLYLMLGLFFLSPLWNWEVNENFAVKPVGALLRSQTPLGTIIYTSFAYGRPSLDFYSDRQVIEADRSRLKELSQKTNYLLLEPAAIEHLSLPSYRILGKAGDFTLVLTQPHSKNTGKIETKIETKN